MWLHHHQHLQSRRKKKNNQGWIQKAPAAQASFQNKSKILFFFNISATSLANCQKSNTAVTFFNPQLNASNQISSTKKSQSLSYGVSSICSGCPFFRDTQHKLKITQCVHVQKSQRQLVTNIWYLWAFKKNHNLPWTLTRIDPLNVLHPVPPHKTSGSLSTSVKTDVTIQQCRPSLFILLFFGLKLQMLAPLLRKSLALCAQFTVLNFSFNRDAQNITLILRSSFPNSSYLEPCLLCFWTPHPTSVCYLDITFWWSS